MAIEIEIPASSPLTIQNIPFGVVSTQDNPKARCATAIGASVIVLGLYSQMGHLSKLSSEISFEDVFNLVIQIQHS